MSQTFYIKSGDTSPSILYELSPASVILTGASVFFLLSRSPGASPEFRKAGSVHVASGTPTVRYDWEAGDTDEPGNFYGEFEVTYADGSIETFPNKGYISVVVTKDLG